MGCDISFIKKVKLTKSANDEGTFEKRILLLGLDNAGKTSLLFQMRDKEFKQTVPTVGLNIEHIVYKRYSMTLWDVGGQATKLWKHYFDHINAVIFVVDGTDEEKMFFARDELLRLMKDQSLIGVPFLIYYNKQDMEDKYKSREELNARLEIDELSKEREISIQECSALSGTGIWEGIDKLIIMFAERNSGGEQAIKQNTQNQDNENASTDKDSKPSNNGDQQIFGKK